MPGSPHDAVKNNLKELFDGSGMDRNVFRCWIEHTLRMPDSQVMIPDVTIFRAERALHHTGATAGAPGITFEVAINDKPWVLQGKISAHMENGAHAVCCVYPNLKTIMIYTAHECRELTERDRLEFPAILPGVTVPVAAIFEGI